MKINILGTEYTIIVEKEETPKLKDANGYCEPFSKEIVVHDYEEDILTCKNIDSMKRKTLRHEIIHAFLNESGLYNNTTWAHNEEIVDWIAIQFPKIKKVFDELKISE